MRHSVDALKKAAVWPGADPRTRVVFASQVLALEHYHEGFGYVAARSAGPPTDELWLGLAAAFESRSGGRLRGRSPSWARLPASISGRRTIFGEPRWPAARASGRTETVVDLEFLRAAKDKCPPGLMRRIQGAAARLRTRQTKETSVPEPTRGLITGYWVTACEGFASIPPRFTEFAPHVHVAEKN